MDSNLAIMLTGGFAAVSGIAASLAVYFRNAGGKPNGMAEKIRNLERRMEESRQECIRKEAARDAAERELWAEVTDVKKIVYRIAESTARIEGALDIRSS